MFLYLVALVFSVQLSDTWLISNILTNELDTVVYSIPDTVATLKGGQDPVSNLVESVLFDILKKHGITVSEKPSTTQINFKIDNFKLNYTKVYKGIFKKPDYERELKLRLFVKVTRKGFVKFAKTFEIEYVDTLAMRDVKKLHTIGEGTVSESSGVPVGVSMLIGVLFYFIYFIIK